MASAQRSLRSPATSVVMTKTTCAPKQSHHPHQSHPPTSVRRSFFTHPRMRQETRGAIVVSRRCALTRAIVRGTRRYARHNNRFTRATALPIGCQTRPIDVPGGDSASERNARRWANIPLKSRDFCGKRVLFFSRCAYRNPRPRIAPRSLLSVIPTAIDEKSRIIACCRRPNTEAGVGVVTPNG